MGGLCHVLLPKWFHQIQFTQTFVLAFFNYIKKSGGLQSQGPIPKGSSTSSQILQLQVIGQEQAYLGDQGIQQEGSYNPSLLGTHFTYTPSVSKQKLHFRKSVSLRSYFALLARNCVHCIALTKRFLVSQGCSQ